MNAAINGALLGLGTGIFESMRLGAQLDERAIEIKALIGNLLASTALVAYENFGSEEIPYFSMLTIKKGKWVSDNTPGNIVISTLVSYVSHILCRGVLHIAHEIRKK